MGNSGDINTGGYNSGNLNTGFGSSSDGSGTIRRRRPGIDRCPEPWCRCTHR
ncbi:hypothetical protein [Mycobacterium riyadhense]|uniref:hypothetical protein n=1 Tax=Mycobacterium riyadhense TaxID=486698 RepID=UPI0025B5C810|nr:hypothetical protein [Mycobacterium riyadhense]